MKKIFTLLTIFVTLSFCQLHAQVPCPTGSPISDDVNIYIGGVVPINVNTGTGGSFHVQCDLPNTSLASVSGTFNGASVKGLALKPGLGNEDKVIFLLSNNTYSIGQFSIGTNNRIQITLSTPHSVDSITIISGTVTKVKGDDYYAIYGGMLAVKRTSMAHWAWDTIGLPGGYATDFDLDSAQNVYVVSGSGLYYQAATGSTWSQVTSYPGTGAQNIMIDKHNRIIIGSSSAVYVSSDHGATWVTGTPASSPGRFGTDAFGNIYTTGGTRSYRSTDGGATWTRIDLPITSHAMDTTLYPIINRISGDTIVYAATVWGLYTSNDQGTTWTINNTGNQSIPNGYWLFNSGRQVANTALGTFIKNSADTAWTQTYPTGGKYLKMGTIQGDTLGNIFTVMNWNGLSMPMKSTDQGATWLPDTSGLASVPHVNLYAYYIDEYGTSYIAGVNNGVWMIYSKTAAGSYAPDTAGIGSQLVNFGDITTYCSDHSGYVYMSGHNNAAGGASIWRRPVTGGTWLPDTVGIGTRYLTASAYDHHGGVFAANWVSFIGLYHRGPAGWAQVNYPTGILSFYLPSAMTGDPSGDLISAFYLANYTNNTYTYKGLFCTHDLGVTWIPVPWADSAYVNSMETFGDTTYMLTALGIYKMTCNGVVVDTVPTGPNGISDINADGIKLYPNPTNGDCHFRSNSSITDGSVLIIQDLMGRTVKTITLSGTGTTFQTNDMYAGMYICTISAGGKVISTKKLVVN